MPLINKYSVILLAVVAFLLMQKTQAATVTVSPLESAVSINETFQLTLLADFSDEPILVGGIDFNFDNTIIEFVEFDFESNSIGVDPDFSRKPTSVNEGLSGLAFGSFEGVRIAGVVGTLTFQAVNLGETVIVPRVTDSLLLGNAFISVIDFVSEVDVDFTGGTVTVVPVAVPVPAAIWFFSSGLMSFFMLRFKNLRSFTRNP